MAFYKTPALETERLILRPLVLDDASAAQPLFNDPEVMKYLFSKTIPQPYPEDGTQKYYETYLMPEVDAGRTLAWTVIEKSSNDLIGTLQIAPEDKDDSRGFWLGSAYHRKGYITEAIIATTDYCFDALKMPQMLLNNAQPNVGSRKIKERAGAELYKTQNAEFVCGVLPKEYWRLTPEHWRNSPMKRAAVDPSYKIIG